MENKAVTDISQKQEGQTTMIPKPSLLSVVLPAHNEAEGIEHAVSVISGILRDNDLHYEIIVVDDGSTDNTYKKVHELHSTYPQLKGICFSRNFGKEAAILAGLRASAGDVVFTLDADLQHPPRLIPQMLEKWQAGAKVVHAVKRERTADSIIARIRAAIFNRLLTALGGIDVRNSSDFKLLDRIAVDVIVNQLPEHRRFYRGLADWLGFEQTCIEFDVESRNAGEGKWTLMSLFDLATTAIVSFTSAPLRIVTILGFATLLFAFIVTLDTLWSWFTGEAVSGFATIIITVLMLGSFIMISLGVMGEYIAKIYEEIKARPIFLVDTTCGFDDDQGS